jgi:hypothetical protein
MSRGCSGVRIIFSVLEPVRQLPRFKSFHPGVSIYVVTLQTIFPLPIIADTLFVLRTGTVYCFSISRLILLSWETLLLSCLCFLSVLAWHGLICLHVFTLCILSFLSPVARHRGEARTRAARLLISASAGKANGDFVTREPLRRWK